MRCRTPYKERKRKAVDLVIRPFTAADLPAMADIWNTVVLAGDAFPQTEPLTGEEAAAFFAGQSLTAVAECAGDICGLYILHPNNVGRCGHIANASYAVKAEARGQHIGEKLVRHSLEAGRSLGFRILQFNAVVKQNERAIRLYEKLGFTRLGEIPGGFLHKDGRYKDIVLFYHPL